MAAPVTALLTALASGPPQFPLTSLCVTSFPYASRYLYLLFCEDDVLSLDDWVFNTEAHPLPVNHTNFKASVQ